MRRIISWLALSVVLAATAGGCAPQTPAPYDLPPHELDVRSLDRDLILVPPPPGSTTKPAAPVAAWAAPGQRAWRHIVIHHSATEDGNAASFDAMHRAKGWNELGYHFVIDNGKGGPDGAVEVGSRWPVQKWGAHTGGTPDNEYNELGIGICLVGNFTHTMPSEAQLASLRNLLAYLMATYDIPPDHVIGHRDAPNAKTECPGDELWKYVHGTLRKELGER